MQSTLSLSRDRTELDLSAQTCVKTSKMNTHTRVYRHIHTRKKPRRHNGENNKHHIPSAQGLTWLSGFITDRVCMRVHE